ncbi:uroporphyrinogen-III synthase [Azospirillum thermophilum]|uniref:Uroporphyrinogen-III synthase n=1 Tax=Azospirillum thermophilum TaxID=2202148 RepID=A0A2S2CYI7_9PROT|nr:uroporphyrinogen-III synthase [Azospirillum thermophilum]AWK89551.1 uroporphyrinogen-III synthase [Azospirillum thermophilum]
MTDAPTLLITRPADDAEPMRSLLRQRGYGVMVEPMLTVRWRTDRHPDPAEVQALLFTSANGVRAFARCSDERALPVLAVGAASAAAAREAGFAAVESADGDVADLAALIRRRCDPAAGALLHAAASAVAGDLGGMLAADGFTVRKEVLYETVPAAALSGETAVALRQGRIAGVTLMSPRTARSFVALLDAAGLLEACRSADMIGLSRAVDEAAAATADGRPVPWRERRVAERPDLDSLLDLLPPLAGAPRP